jgi:ADP-heptose:LPS heptosyltransferase
MRRADLAPRLPHIDKILVLRPNAVGDFMLCLPALHALRTAYPQAHIVFIGKPWHASFLAGRPGPVDQVELMPPYPGVGAPADAVCDPQPIADFIHRMRAERFDLALQLYGGGRYANPFIMQLGARHTVGLRAQGAAPLDASIAYGAWHSTRLQLLEVAALAGASMFDMGPELCVTERDRHEAAQVLPQASARPLVLLQPGASDRRRWWPVQHFAAVGDALAQQGARIAINGSAAEHELAAELAARMRHEAIDLSGKLSLSGLCGLLERTSLVVSNDSGPLHMAVALDTPSVGIYWLSNLIASMPLRQNQHRVALSTQINCPVCGQANLVTRCSHEVSFVADVSVAHVQALADELITPSLSSALACASTSAARSPLGSQMQR